MKDFGGINVHQRLPELRPEGFVYHHHYMIWYPHSITSRVNQPNR